MGQPFELSEGMTVYHYSPGSLEPIVACLVRHEQNWRGEMEYRLYPQGEFQFGCYTASDKWWLVFYATREAAEAARAADLEAFKSQIASREGLMRTLFNRWQGNCVARDEWEAMQARILDEFGVDVR